ncbi:hypothetical protein IWX49DRAFT_223764 [Phyllosticta citricarpa]|uniref:Uncharacterized protein n=2 Tax=Phyllosticta TaxID=121621 RepID=A0ABR1MMV8_9PEZI
MARRRSSQDSAASDNNTRGIRRKRRSSTPSVMDPNSDLHSIREESSDAEPSKRGRKRVKRVSLTQEEELTQVDPPDASSPPQHRDKRVRFSDPGPPLPQATPLHNSTASSSAPQHSTPTPRRNPVQASRSKRLSLPASLSGAISPDGSQIQFTPLRALLDDRKRRRLRRSGLSEEMNSIEEHRKEDKRARLELQRLRQQIREKDKRVEDLYFELEVQRQFAIEVQEADKEKEQNKVKELEQQLDALRAEIAEQRERHDLTTIDEEDNEDLGMGMDMDGGLSDDDDDDDQEDNHLMLVEPEDINLSHDDVPQFTSDGIDEVTFDEQATQANVPDPSHEIQIQKLENTIAELNERASDAEVALRILSMEIQTLGFTEPDANAYDALTSIRSTLQHVRNEIEAVMPGDPSTQLHNGELLYAVVEKLRLLKSDIDTRTAELRDEKDVVALLNSQNKGLISKMAEYENRRTTLEGQWHELDVVNEKKSKEIIELEEELDAYKTAVDERDKEIVELDQKIDEMEVELEDRDSTVQRFDQTILDLKNEASSLQSLIEQMKKDHTDAFAQLKEESAAAIATLNEQLATEKSYREQAEADIDQKTTFITELEVKVERAETELENLRDDLGRLQELQEKESAQREAAEDELEDKASSIRELEQKVDVAEEEVEELRGELERLRNIAEAEREQREAAEAEIEEKDDKIAEMEDKIHEAGKQANELRQKLFELQLQKQAAIDELQETAAKREEQYNQDIAAEIKRREDAEQVFAERNAEIAELQARLEAIEEDKEALIVEKDDLIDELERRVDKLDADLAQLREEYETLAAQKAEEIKALHDDIAILNTDVNEKAALISKLQDEAAERERAHAVAIQEYQSRIETLASDNESARTTIQTLESTKNSLEARVADEAEAMLQLQNRHADEIDQLRSRIDSNESEIDRLKRAVELREEKYTSDINSKNKELETLQMLADARLSTISTLETAFDDLKKRFRDQTLSSQKVIGRLTDGIRAAANEAQDRGDLFVEEAERAIGEVDALRPLGVNAASGNDRVRMLKSSANAAKKPRRQWDSGIGVAEEDEDELGEAMMG